MEKIYSNECSCKSGTYKILNKINGHFYVGSCKRFKQRWLEHERALLKNKHFNKHLQRAFNLYGSDSFVFEIIEVIEGDKQLRIDAEQNLLDKFWNLNECYNLCKFAQSPDGKIFSKTPTETIKKMSKAKQGNKNPFFDKKHTNESKKQISDSRKGKYTGKNNPNYGNLWTKKMKQKMSRIMINKCKDPDYQKKLSDSHKGQRLSEEHKKNIGIALKGRPAPNKGKNHTDLTKNKISNSLKETYKNINKEEKEKRRIRMLGDKNPAARSVYKIDKITGEILQKYNTLKEAAIDLNLPKATGSNISSCCSGRQKSAYGFFWKYDN